MAFDIIYGGLRHLFGEEMTLHRLLQSLDACILSSVKIDGGIKYLFFHTIEHSAPVFSTFDILTDDPSSIDEVKLWKTIYRIIHTDLDDHAAGRTNIFEVGPYILRE